jgi:hypothetical protein
MADPMQAPPPPPAPTEAPAAPGGYTIELKVSADGKMSVSVEPDVEEAGEEAGVTPPPDGAAPVPPEDDSQDVASLGEALKLIREIVMRGGEQTDMGASQDEMSSGYGAGA